MQPARPVNRPRPNANPAGPGGAPAKVESRAFFIPPIFAPATPSRSIDGGVPVFDREKCGHCGACIWNRAQPLPDNPERTDIAFRAGTDGLPPAGNPSSVRSEILVENQSTKKSQAPSGAENAAPVSQSSHFPRAPAKAPEGWRSPRRFALLGSRRQTLRVLECGGPPPLFCNALCERR